MGCSGVDDDRYAVYPVEWGDAPFKPGEVAELSFSSLPTECHHRTKSTSTTDEGRKESERELLRLLEHVPSLVAGDFKNSFTPTKWPLPGSNGPPELDNCLSRCYCSTARDFCHTVGVATVIVGFQ
ncbi:hypothetical protein J6590_098720 [Homalodisca vitripennis]|nr:hypothetical protein J6590_098720 [Homalodisca vitripennis]